MLRKYSNKSAIVFDDHTMFSESFTLVLEGLDYFVSVSSANSKKELLFLLMRMNEQPVYLFLDYYIPDCNVNNLISDIAKLFSKVKIVLISSLNNTMLVKQVIQSNLAGFISKVAKISEIVTCINSIENGRFYLSPYLQEVLKNEDPIPRNIAFTTRELDILRCSAKGKSIQQTAELLHVSRHTIISHRRNMMGKMNCHSISELVAYGVQSGLV